MRLQKYVHTGCVRQRRAGKKKQVYFFEYFYMSAPRHNNLLISYLRSAHNHQINARDAIENIFIFLEEKIKELIKF